MEPTTVAIKAVTIYQTIGSISSPITIAGLIRTNGSKDLVDYIMAFGSIGSLFVGLFAVWYSVRTTREGDLNKRFLDVVVSMSEEKFQGLAPVLNQMHQFVQLLESGVIKEGQIFSLFWNSDPNYVGAVTTSFEKLNYLLGDTVKYQSPEFQTHVDIFKLKFDETTLGEDNKIKQLSVGSWLELVEFEKKMLNDSIELIKLETNRQAISMIWKNDPKKFYALLKRNPEELKEYLQKNQPILKKLKEKYSSWRENKFYKKPETDQTEFKKS
jgi:hypothetical protein